MTAVILKSTMTYKATVRLLLYYDHSNLSFWGFRHALFLISQHWSCSGISLYSKDRKVIAACSRHEGEAGPRDSKPGMERVGKREAGLGWRMEKGLMMRINNECVQAVWESSVETCRIALKEAVHCFSLWEL